MAHISSLGAGIFTYIDVFKGTIAGDVDTAAEVAALFVGTTPGTPDADHLRFPSVREFPSIGTPANIVNVPVYGQKTSSQVQGQSDAPSLEVTVNYVAEDMEAFHTLSNSNDTLAFRFMMCATSVDAASGSAATLAVENTEFYFLGKVEAIMINPALTDTSTATITLSTQSEFFGPATIASA